MGASGDPVAVGFGMSVRRVPCGVVRALGCELVRGARWCMVWGWWAGHQEAVVAFLARVFGESYSAMVSPSADGRAERRYALVFDLPLVVLSRWGGLPRAGSATSPCCRSFILR